MYKKSFFLIPFQRFNRLHNLKNDYVQGPKAAVMYLNLNTISKSYCKYFFSRFRYNLFTGSYFSVRLSRSKIYCSEMTGTDRDKCNVTSTYTLHILFLFFFFFLIFHYSMGRLCQCRRHVSFWTYHKRSE